jgi:voltage-gated potassium channel
MAKYKQLVLSPTYQVAMLVLCAYALGVLAIQVAVDLDPDVRTVLDYADYAVCLIFFVDFLVSLWLAPSRWRYMTSWGWLDLLSSIPTLEVVRWGRAARVVRVFRVLRGLRATKLLTTAVLRRRAQNTFLVASLAALLLIIFCSVAILQFESGPESNIKTADDAVWWAFATITTVGYGDRYPTTGEGRFVAGVLMCAGVGLFGTFSGFLAAWFLESDVKEEISEIAALRAEIQALRHDVANITEQNQRAATAALSSGREPS